MNNQKNNTKSALTTEEVNAAPFSIDDFALKVRSPSADKATISFEGQDVILIENLGQPLIEIKPINGDFSIINYFGACARNWLSSLKRSDHQLVNAVELWMEFKAFKEKLGMSANEFLDQLSEPVESYAPGRF